MTQSPHFIKVKLQYITELECNVYISDPEILNNITLAKLNDPVNSQQYSWFYESVEDKLESGEFDCKNENIVFAELSLCNIPEPDLNDPDDEEEDEEIAETEADDHESEDDDDNFRYCFI